MRPHFKVLGLLLGHVSRWSVLRKPRRVPCQLCSTSFLKTQASSLPRLGSKETTSVERTTLPGTVKKHPVVQIWEGMSPLDLAKVTRKTPKQVNEAIRSSAVNFTGDVKDARRVVTILGFRSVVIKPPTDAKGLVSKSAPEEEPRVTGTKIGPRPPVVTIMGHVDHGKTTLLDALRKSELVKREHGGITQHIGAFVVSLADAQKQVKTDGTTNIKNLVTFLDTPGHAAFHAMRERGAHVTDIVVLVVAADDGVLQQTVESINFAKDCNVPIIVAINKMDKIKGTPNELEHVKRGLMAQGLILEEDGGDTQAIKLSALKGTGLDELKEAILALAELQQLKAFTDGHVEGTVLESCIHPHRGRLATVLIQSGTLKKGNVITAGHFSWAKVRSLFDEWGNIVQKVSSGFPVQVIGWKDDILPDAGDKVNQVDGEKKAKDVVAQALLSKKLKKAEADAEVAQKRLDEHQKGHREELESRRAAGRRYSSRKRGINREKEMQDDPDADKKINLLVKADVNGSLEVLLDVFDTYPNELHQVQMNLLHYGVGPITESDIDLASCFDNTIIYGFNITIPPKTVAAAKELDVGIRPYNVIYHLVDDLKREVNARLPEIDEEEVLGEAVVLQEFVITEKNKKIPVAGSRCTKGTIKRAKCFYRLQRGEQVLAEKLEIVSMRHLKDEVDSIKKDVECGLRFDTSSCPDIIKFQNSDVLICYQMKKVKQKTNWSPPGF